MARDKGHLTDLHPRRWTKAGQPLAKAPAARDWTVPDLAWYYRAKKLVSLAYSTQVSYGRHLKRVDKKLGALTVREIEASDVVALIEGCSRTPAASG